MRIRFGIIGTALLLAVGCSTEDEVKEMPETPVVEEAAIVEEVAEEVAEEIEIDTSFVSAEFDVPELVVADGFKVVPLGPDLVEVDYVAYMSSIEHLQKTFTRSTNWPHAGLTDADAMLDMETEEARFTKRESFAYAVLTPDGSRERGCVYVYPSPIEGYDAMVRLWVTAEEFEAGFDEELFAWAQSWVEADWPFATVAYPGRSIEWSAWDEAVAEQKVKDQILTEANLQTAESFIDAFYSFDPDALGGFMQETDDSAERILYYQGWAEGGNYIVMERGACVAESPTLIRCPITVQDDPVVALKTGFNVTDTFHITFLDTAIASIDTSSNDQPIYYEARKWVEENMPEVMSGPCMERGTNKGTPQDCARAMTEGYKQFYAATRGSESAE